MLEIKGDQVRITGLRMRGPPPSLDTTLHSRGIRAHDQYISIIDHNDLSDWPSEAIGALGDDDYHDPHDPRHYRPQNVRIARNFIHHNQQNGFGYGVDVGGSAYPLIEGNTFLSNRHAIAGGGGDWDSYHAWFNLVQFPAPHYDDNVEHDFDMHGQLDTCGQHCGGTAGAYIEIARNTFLGGNRYNFVLRGTPTVLAEFHNNVTVASLSRSIRNEGDASKLIVTDTNRFEAPNPTNRLGVGDFDGDGKDDLFLATGAAWYYAPAGQAEWRYLNDMTVEMGSLLFGDFDGDGRTDVFTQRGREWFVSWGGASPWEKINESDARMTDFAIGDFDDDHRADVFYADGQTWFVSSGGVAPFTALDTSGFRIPDLRFGDFNGDGKTDVFSVVSGQWMVAYSGTSGWQPLRAKLTDSVANLTVGDFNGDGRADVATSSCLVFCVWKVSYSGTGDWTTLRSAVVPLASAAAIGRFDGNVGEDVLLWHDNYLDIASGGSGASRHQSRQDMR
jgi:VCBS repeat protein